MGRSGIFLALLLIGCLFSISTGCLFSISTAIEEDRLVTLGIDLGTSTSYVGVYINNKVEIIPNDQGNRTTPSWVAFTDSETPLIGEAAKNQAAVNPERTIFDVKRLIGRKFEDKEVQRHMKLVPYKVVNKDGKPYIQVKVKDGDSEFFSPEEISAMILTKMKETAEAFLRKKITNVVVPVPAYFNDAQRQATKEACFMAGYDVVRIINEPTSAGFAYRLHNEAGEKNILVFDLGDATFDVSVSTIETGVFEVLATTHTHLGARFEEVLKKAVKEAIQDSGLKKQQIDDIILVGQTDNIYYPKVQKLLKDYFDGKEPKTSVNPDEAVVVGAAVLGDAMADEWRDTVC